MTDKKEEYLEKFNNYGKVKLRRTLNQHELYLLAEFINGMYKIYDMDDYSEKVKFAAEVLRSCFNNFGRDSRHQRQDFIADVIEKLGLDPITQSRVAASSQTTADVEVVALPDVAPLLWEKRDRKLKQTPVAFIQEQYGDYLGKGLTQAHIRRLDKGLYNAFHQWVRQKGNELPEEFDLPTRKSQNDKGLAKTDLADKLDDLSKLTPEERERLRLYALAYNRLLKLTP